MKKTILITTLVITALIFACKKQQPQMSEDIKNPCDCATEVSAEFKMEELAGYPGTSLAEKKSETDTIYGNSPVMFTALEDGADYTWYLGAEVIKEKEFWRYFNNTLIGQTLPVSLVVKKNPNTTCLPNDDGYDSISKTITVVDGAHLYTAPNHFEGTYRLRDTASTDSIDIVIDFDNNFDGGGKLIVFYNIGLYNGGSEIACSSSEVTYRKFWCGWSGCFQSGFLHVIDVNHVELKINGATLLSQCASSYHYYGRKLN